MHRPFKIPEDWVRQGRIRLKPDSDAVGQGKCADEPSDAELFERAMRGVRPIEQASVRHVPSFPVEVRSSDGEDQALRVLEDFCRNGSVDVEQTREYVEGFPHPLGRFYLDDLRTGRFSIQAHLDLHGLGLRQARSTLEAFLEESVRFGHSCVRIVHGRGRHSPKHRSVLKGNVRRWLGGCRLSRFVGPIWWMVVAVPSMRSSAAGDRTAEDDR